MTVFKLPDLGEGLPDAEIVNWLVNEGDEVPLDQPLVSMETAKAVVEVPSPVTGRVIRFHGQAGDVIQTGAPLVEFEVEGETAQAAAEPEQESIPEEESLPQEDPEPDPQADEADDNDPIAAALAADLAPGDDAPVDEPHGPEELYDEFSGASEDSLATATEPANQPQNAAQTEPPDDSQQASDTAKLRDDSGTVVGNVQAGNELLQERASEVGGARVTPAVRALARKLRVDIRQVRPTGAGEVITAADVRQAAADGSASAEPGPAPAAPTAHTAPTAEPPAEPEAVEEPAAAPVPQPAGDGEAEWTPVRGPRRTMARIMAASHRSVVPTTLMDDADIHAWRPGEDITVRLIRALWAGASAEPGLNAWFDGDNGLRMLHKNLHVGMAVDTEDGLFVAALRNVNRLERTELRAEINRLRDNAANRSIPPEDLKDYTIVLSNFGKFAGRYATPVITPPCVSIVAAGTLRHEVVPVLGGMEVHRVLPLSLTFDHRACTGGEAARFLKAMLDDLARAE